MDRVNIMTYTTCTSATKQKCAGMWLVELLHNGKPQLKGGFLKRDCISRQELTLQLLINATYLLKRSGIEYESICFYTDEPIIQGAFVQKWLEQWEGNNWLNAKGNEVKHADLWKLLNKQIRGTAQRYIVSEDKSRYHTHMMTRTAKLLKEEGD